MNFSQQTTNAMTASNLSPNFYPIEAARADLAASQLSNTSTSITSPSIVEITSDVNNDGYLTGSELDGYITYNVTIPKGSLEGDILNISYEYNEYDAILLDTFDVILTPDIINKGYSDFVPLLNLQPYSDFVRVYATINENNVYPINRGDNVDQILFEHNARPLQPTVVITSDSDSNRRIEGSEMSSEVAYTITIPKGTVVGDTLLIKIYYENTANTLSIDITDDMLINGYLDTITVNEHRTSIHHIEIQAGINEMRYVEDVGIANVSLAISPVPIPIPTVIISSDIDDDGNLDQSERGDKVHYVITVPEGTQIGDMLTVQEAINHGDDLHKVNHDVKVTEDILANGYENVVDISAHNHSVLSTTVSAAINTDIDYSAEGSTAMVTFQDTSETLTIEDDLKNDAQIDLGNGDNIIDIGDDVKGNATIKTGNGNDTLTIGDDVQNSANIDLGNGNNKIVIADDVKGHAKITTGQDNDHVLIEGSTRFKACLTLGDGNDLVTVKGQIRTASHIDLGAGDDVLVVEGGSRIRGDIEGGDGQDTLLLDYTLNDHLTTSRHHVSNASTDTFTGIEVVKLEGNNVLDIRFSDLLDDTSRDGALFVQGHENSKVDLGSNNRSSDSANQANLNDSNNGAWSKTDSTEIDDIVYDVYHNAQSTSSDTDVYIEQGIVVI